MSDTSKVAEYWSKNEPLIDAPNFYTSPLTRPYIIENAFGKEYVKNHRNDSAFAENILIELYLKERKIESVLSICCGFGHVERNLVKKLDTIKECIGIDIAEGALAVARQRANDEGITSINYLVADLNNYDWTKKKYDLVVANGALHHISNLEEVFEGISSCLNPGGILIACEYVGPSFQDHSIRQLEIINAAAYLVPPELRVRKGRILINEKLFRFLSSAYAAVNQAEKNEWPIWKKIVAKVGRIFLNKSENKFNFGIVHISPKTHLLKVDPSECVRSAELISVAKKYFKNLEVRPMGGGILQHAFDIGFYNSFKSSNTNHVSTFEAICQLEKHFMRTGEIGIENAFLIATN